MFHSESNQALERERNRAHTCNKTQGWSPALLGSPFSYLGVVKLRVGLYESESGPKAMTEVKF